MFYPGEKLPHRRTELYREICDLQLGARPLAKRIHLVLDSPQERQAVLQAVALKMVQQNWVQIERAEMLTLIAPHLRHQDETVAAADFLQQMVDVSELLYEPDTEEYAFSHLSFRNYLAAQQLQQHLRQTSQHSHLFSTVWQEDHWQETILLYTSELKPAAFKTLLHQVNTGADALVALECWHNHPRHQEAALIGELPLLIEAAKTTRYQRLEEYLNAQQWRKADLETYFLMITTVGKPMGAFYSASDLETFPCEDLLKIDQLWRDASGGNFGFSAQKQIWQECGSPMSYDNDTRSQWEHFGNRVRWYKDGGKRESYDDLFSFSTYEPGHLPCSGWVFGGTFEGLFLVWSGGRVRSGEIKGVGGGGVGSLLSRPDLPSVKVQRF